ncbi:MAG: OmpA family protein [Acetobacteraceae bacterium]
MQGGKIAEQRPEPPGADDAYPNLSTVPARPTPPDREAMQKLTTALVGDRTNAQYTAEAAPLPDPSSPSASPNLFGKGTMRPPAPPAAEPSGPPAASASLPAASAPPAPAAPPSRAPTAPVQSSPLDAPAPVASAAPPPGTGTATPPPSGAELAPAPLSTGPLPPMPSAPPPRPGVAPAPPGPPPAAIAPIPPFGSADAGSAIVGFPPGSATLSPTAAEAVKQFAAKRGSASVVITGYGDAVSADPGAQTAALSLALSRAQTVANALAAAGVPQAALRVGAEAAGRGASLRLLQ